MHIRKNYIDSINYLLNTIKIDIHDTDISPIDLNNFNSISKDYLSPVELLFEDEWDIITPTFSNTAVLIDRCILHSTSKGRLEAEHVPLTDMVRSRVKSAIPDGDLKYIVVDSRKLEGGTRLARKEYMRSLKKWAGQNPLEMYIMYGTGTYMKAALNLAKPFLPFKIKIAKDIDHAFELIRDSRSKDGLRNNAFIDTSESIRVEHRDFEKLTAFIGNLNWEEEGITYDVQFEEGHPLYFIYQSLKLIKDEIDELFKERMDFEAQLVHSRKMEAIGTLAGGIAHEFNNVLAIILGNAELAIEDVPRLSLAKESLKAIRTASLRGEEVVRQILSFARKTMTPLKPLEINRIVKESLKLMRASIPAMIDIRQNIPSEPLVTLGDPTEIHQILINICTNSAHAMKEKGGVLEVSLQPVILNEQSAFIYEDLTPGSFVKLSIRDTGEGIAPDILEMVLEPYFTTKAFGAGSGMGLAVVYGLVKKCGGAIHIKSAVGTGTTVEILFPKIENEVPPAEENEGEWPNGNERILLVDDDPLIVKMVRQMLEGLGYTVFGMTDSLAALKRFQSSPADFDLVFTDMAMPFMSGDQLAAELIKVRKDIPILLCTGHSDTINEKTAKEIGIKGFALKPLHRGKLAKAVRAALDGP